MLLFKVSESAPLPLDVPQAADMPEDEKFRALCPGLQTEDPLILTAGLERADLLFAMEGLESEHLELVTFPGLHTEDFITILFGLETGDFTLQ